MTIAKTPKLSAVKHRLPGGAFVAAMIVLVIGLRGPIDAAPTTDEARWAIVSPRTTWPSSKEMVQGRLTLEENPIADADGRCILVPVVEIKSRVGSATEVRLNLQKLTLKIEDSHRNVVETRGGPLSGPNIEWLYGIAPGIGSVSFRTLSLSIGSAPGTTNVHSNAGDWELPEGTYTLRGTAAVTVGRSRTLDDFLAPLRASSHETRVHELRRDDIQRTGMTIELEPVTFKISR